MISAFKGIIDLMRGVAYYYKLDDDKDQGRTIVEKPIPEEEKERFNKWRHDLIEKVAETDDHLMQKYLEGVAPPIHLTLVANHIMIGSTGFRAGRCSFVLRLFVSPTIVNVTEFGRAALAVRDRAIIHKVKCKSLASI